MFRKYLWTEIFPWKSRVYSAGSYGPRREPRGPPNRRGFDAARIFAVRRFAGWQPRLPPPPPPPPHARRLGWRTSLCTVRRAPRRGATGRNQRAVIIYAGRRRRRRRHSQRHSSPSAHVVRLHVVYARTRVTPVPGPLPYAGFSRRPFRRQKTFRRANMSAESIVDGLSARELFGTGEGLTYKYVFARRVRAPAVETGNVRCPWGSPEFRKIYPVRPRRGVEIQRGPKSLPACPSTRSTARLPVVYRAPPEPDRNKMRNCPQHRRETRTPSPVAFVRKRHGSPAREIRLARG